MKLRDILQAKIEAHQAEIAKLQAHLAAGGAFLDQELSTLEAWFAAAIEKLRGIF